MITVKHDQSIKLALDSKLLNDAIDKNKYQMQSIDNLMDSVAKYISDNKNEPGKFLFSKTDLKYAYSQIPLHPEIRKHCNFNILGGKSTGTYQFINGFYGLSDMPATFQKTLDKTLENIDNKFNFLDDILIITKGSPHDHESDIYKVLSRLDKENLAIKLGKCEFAKSSITWLGYKITQSGISPTVNKTDSILNLKPPNTLKQLRSLMGSIHQLIKFIPNLANLLNPIRPLLKKENINNNKIRWENSHTTTLDKIKAEISKITEKKHFDKQRNTRLKCDASHTGLGAVLEQQYPEGWFPIAYASRFLNEAEIKYSTNELELLSVVWATNHFKYYLLGSKFELITDHTALLSALKPNWANKSRQSRLIRWVDKLLPYTFTIKHLPGKDMGFTDYLSRNPHQRPPPISPDDELFVINRIRVFTFTLLNEERKHKISSNQNAPFGQTHKSHDVISHSQHAQNKANAFCHLSTHNQLHSLSLLSPNFKTQNSLTNFQNSSHKNIQNFNNIENPSNLVNLNQFISSNSQTIPPISNPHNYYPNPPLKVNVVTRNNPNLNTFDRQIVKRARKPNKRTMLSPNSDTPSTFKTPISVANQTGTIPPPSNIGQGRTPKDETKHAPLFEFENETPPNYRLHLARVFGEEFLAEATLRDRNLQAIIRLVKSHNWDELKLVSKYFYNLRNDLSVAQSGCLIYDGKLVIPHQLQNLVINAVHRTHPSQVGMIRLANLIWFPQIHRTIALRAENCKQCLDQGKNLKSIIPKSDLGALPKLSEPNEEL